VDLDALLGLLKDARVYDLELPRFNGMPSWPLIRPGFHYALFRHHEDYYRPDKSGPRGSAAGLMMISDHSGTHFDALCHQSADLVMYGGIRIGPDVQTPYGFTRLGIETVPPVLRRGVLLDIPALKGLDELPPRYPITRADLEGACERQHVRPTGGDVLLVRTGAARHWDDEARYLDAAGVGKDGTVWVGERGVYAAGADNVTWDVVGLEDPETKMTNYSHVHLIAQRGVHILKNLNLEELAADRRSTFLFVCLPLKIKGATGSPVRPIALA
jgi:kynurenine formamidase